MTSKQRIFEAHGVRFTGESGDQLFGYCPFSNREDKFYVNQKTWLWDSKTAGTSGNVARFLELTAQRYRRALTPAHLARLAADRQLPVEAFSSWEIGWTGHQYALIVRDPNMEVVDIRFWRIGGRVLSTPAVNVGLWNAHRLNSALAAPIFLCEGEWDAIAMQWLLKQVSESGIVLAVPGAGTFKPDWVPWFAGRVVHTLFDHDDAGRQGEVNVYKRLGHTIQRITFTAWPDICPMGFDLRDWVIQRAVVENSPNRCWNELKKLFTVWPRLSENGRKSLDGSSPAAHPPPSSSPTGKATGSTPPPSRWKTPPSLDQVLTTFRKWLYLEGTDPILVMLATVVSQVIDGPPIWMFLVGPPGSAKTEILASLTTYANIYSTSSLTVHSLISGASFKDGVDPSLIPRLDGKVMVIKDFTSILAMRDTEKDEIFGILRDAYDGKCGKVFGTGIERQYESRFTILAAVTPRIYDLSSQHTALGERFLKYTMADNLYHPAERDIIRRAIQNINHESEMRDELQDVVDAFLTRTVRTNVLPTIPVDMQKRIIYLAMFGARMRGSVARDTYRHDIVTSRPSAEVGSRLGIQLAKLGQALALVCGRTEVTMADFAILKKVILDTIPQRTEDILRHLLKAMPADDGIPHLTAHDLAASSRYPIATVSRLLQDMNVLDVVTRHGTLYRYRWTLTPYIKECLAETGLYQSPAELNRPTRVFVRVKRHRKRETPDVPVSPKVVPITTKVHRRRITDSVKSRT